MAGQRGAAASEVTHVAVAFRHPFSSYCQKVLIALYENETDFAWRLVGPEHPENGLELARLWPPGKFPLLLDGTHPVMESSIIIEHLQHHHPGPVRLIPGEPGTGLAVRRLDRVFDNSCDGQHAACCERCATPAGPA